MTLPLYDGGNYKLTRESPEFQKEYVEARDGAVAGGWESRVPARGPDGVPFQFIFVGPTSEHRGSAVRVKMMAKGGGEVADEATVRVESAYKTGSERVVIYEGPYGQFKAIADQWAPDAAVAAQTRAESGEDYYVRVEVEAPAGTPAPDPYADDSCFELECVKLWWNETA
jgi:hypothetical protein